MKTITIITFFGLVFSLALTGQADNNSNLSGYQKNDNSRITIFSDDTSKYGSLNKKFKLPDYIPVNPDLEIGQKHFNIESPAIKNFDDKLLSEKFPGSDRYYAKRPVLINPDENSFIKKPDTNTKYFLIIKNPSTIKISK